MGEVTVYFVGICTHMQWPEDEVFGKVEAFRHRVVLVNGTEPREINRKPIPKHLPMMLIEATDIIGNIDGREGKWKLDGATIEIANAAGELQYDKSFECCVPHLKVLTPNLPPPSFRVVMAAKPEHASAYFDLTAGVLTAGITKKGAAVSILTVTTRDESPVLRIRGFDAGEQQDFHLRDGATIVISNVGEEEVDGDDDFLLHYETAEFVPLDAKVPAEAAGCCEPVELPKLAHGAQNVGPGCSNSNFP